MKARKLRRAKPLPNPRLAWFGRTDPMPELAEVLLQQAFRAAQAAHAAQTAQQALIGRDADSEAFRHAAAEALALGELARALRAEALTELRHVVGHAARDAVREQAAAAVRHRAAAATRADFLQAVATCRAMSAELTASAVLMHWPGGRVAPVITHVRRLLAAYRGEPGEFVPDPNRPR